MGNIKQKKKRKKLKKGKGKKKKGGKDQMYLNTGLGSRTPKG